MHGILQCTCGVILRQCGCEPPHAVRHVVKDACKACYQRRIKEKRYGTKSDPRES